MQEKAMVIHSSALAWRVPWTEKPGRLQSMGSQNRMQLSNFTFTFHFHALEKEMATHSSVLAWRIPGMGDPGGLLSMGLHRVGHDWSDLAAAAVQETVQSLGQEDPLEKEMANHSSILAWKIPWMEEPGRLAVHGSQKVRHNWVTSGNFI